MKKYLKLMGIASSLALSLSAANAFAGSNAGSAESLGLLTSVSGAISTVSQVLEAVSASQINGEQAKALLDLQMNALRAVRESATGIKQIQGGQSYCLDEVSRESSTTIQSIQLYTSDKIDSGQLLALLDMQKHAATTVVITCQALSGGNGVER